MFKQLVIASLAIASIATAAQAQSSEFPSVKVSFAGLDTHSDSGVRIMLRRIQSAAGTVCGPEPSVGLERMTRYEPCVREVTQRTVAALSNPRLAALLSNGEIGAPQAKLASAK